MKNATPIVVTLLLALPLAATAQIQLYKLIHPNGKVEYSEKPPKDFPGKVIPLNVNPDANTASMPKPAPSGGEGNTTQRAAAGEQRNEARAQAARDRLDNARKALKDAQDNPQEGDVARVGNAGGGTRPVPSDAYQERLARLERAVKDAEESLRALEKN